MFSPGAIKSAAVSANKAVGQFNQIVALARGRGLNINYFQSDKEPKLDYSEKYKMAFVVRSDLKMGKGKIAAQVGHGVLNLSRTCPTHVLDHYLAGPQTKICLKVNNERSLQHLYTESKKFKIPSCIVQDAGKTQVVRGTNTVCAIGPAPASVLDLLTKDLKLM